MEKMYLLILSYLILRSPSQARNHDSLRDGGSIIEEDAGSLLNYGSLPRDGGSVDGSQIIPMATTTGRVSRTSTPC